MVQKGRVRVGAVSYLNTKPLIHTLLNHTQNPGWDEIDLILDVPSCLADSLKKGELDVGLIPIIEYFRAGVQSSGGGAYQIIPDISISSRGPVQSIQLLSHVPISAIRRVALDTSSRTSHALLHILLAEQYQIYPEFTACSPSIDPQQIDADAVLLIGDVALKRLGSTDYGLDLGGAWSALTGLPFVYACWVARAKVDLRNVPDILLEAKARGVNQISDIAQIEAANLGLPIAFCQDYLTKHIFYVLGESEIAGMMKFYELAVKYRLAPPNVPLRFV